MPTLKDSSVLIVASDPRVVAGALQVLLEAVGSILFAHGVREAAARAEAHAFDLAIVDSQLPDGAGLAVVRNLRQPPTPRAAVLLSHRPPDPIMVQHSIELGVVDVLLHPLDPRVLLEATARARNATHAWQERSRWACGPDPYDEPSATDPVAGRAHLRGVDLTVREHQVLDQMVGGATYTAIARNFGISANTVKYHARNLLRKLGVQTRRELVRLLHESNGK